MGERKAVKKVNGGDDSTDLEYTNPNKRAIHIHVGMEHNLARYAKYYSYGNTWIIRSSEFTKEIDHIRKVFSRYW